MHSLLRPSLASPDLPPHCSPSSDFLAQLSFHLNICLPTPLALLSSTLGLLSIASWLFAQLPQIFVNYALGSANGLSIYFLAEWGLGDTTNLLGAILTNQAAWQVVVAGYYVLVDIVLVGQYAWYNGVQTKRRRRKTLSRPSTVGYDHGRHDHDGDGLMSHRNGSGVASMPMMDGTLPETMDQQLEDRHSASSRRPQGATANEKDEPRRCDGPIRSVTRPMAGPSRSTLALTPPKSLLFLSLLCALVAAHPSPGSGPSLSSVQVPQESPVQLAGRISSWSSTVLYLGSRFPQLYMNYRRRSTSGLSAKLFAAAFFGNLFYSSSLLTNPCAWYSFPAYGGRGWVGSQGSDRLEWIGRAFPFWLGAAGVLALDAAIGVQFLMYRDAIDKKIVRDGPGRWRKLTGWMRGWAPSMRRCRPSRVREEHEALLGRMDLPARYDGV